MNEEEIENIFQRYGFSIIIASELTAKKKAELFSTAKFVAGPLGAAITYASFSLNAEIIALSSDLYFENMYLDMASLQMSKIHYFRGVGLKFHSDVWGYEHSSFYMPPTLVEWSLNAIFKSIN